MCSLLIHLILHLLEVSLQWFVSHCFRPKAPLNNNDQEFNSTLFVSQWLQSRLFTGASQVEPGPWGGKVAKNYLLTGRHLWTGRPSSHGEGSEGEDRKKRKMNTYMSIHYSWFIPKFGLPWSTGITPNAPSCITKSSSVTSDTSFFFVFLDPTVVSEAYLHVGVSSHFAWGGAAAPWAAAASHSPMLRGAESGSLTCLIAFDSSLSSPVDQWSSVLFIRNINAPHIPTASATAQRVHPEREALFSESLLLLALRVPYFRIIAIVCFSWFQH